MAAVVSRVLAVAHSRLRGTDSDGSLPVLSCAGVGSALGSGNPVLEMVASTPSVAFSPQRVNLSPKIAVLG